MEWNGTNLFRYKGFKKSPVTVFTLGGGGSHESVTKCFHCHNLLQYTK